MRTFQKELKVKMAQRGFTILELMITVFIITVGLIGVSGLINQTLSYASLNPSKLTASYLAQEGIEIARNIVDTNLIEGDAVWDDGLQGFCAIIGVGSGCIVDYSHSYGPNQEDPILPSYSGQYLNIDGNNFYSYSAGTPTKFQRKITINSVGADILNIIVEVSWQDRGKDYKVAVQEDLYNWRQ